jgi:secreted trypsin-like serine protease
MKRLLSALIAAGSILAVTVAPAAAITKNYVKDFDHTFVGLIAFYNADGVFQHRCTGELLAPTVVLTAGHCTDNGTGGVEDNARIWFRQDAGTRFNGVTVLEDPETGYPNECLGTMATNPCAESHLMYNYGFDNFAGFPNTHDTGLVILDEPVDGLGFASLASAGTLDPLDSAKGIQDKTFRVSGYGISHSAKQGTVTISFRERLQADETLVNTVNQRTAGFNIQLNGNGDDRGGTCSGDSGGPVFWPSTSNQVVAVTSFGQANAGCRGDGFYYRTDRQAVIDWILDHAGSAADDIVVG